VPCYFGYPKNTPNPGPHELRRQDIQSGEYGIVHPLKFWKLEGYQKYADGNVWEVPIARRFEFEKSESQFAEKNLLVELAEFFKTATAAQTVSGESVQKLLPGVYSPNG
jgi:hypothetical protein